MKGLKRLMEKIRSLLEQFDQRELRERMIVFGTLLVAVILGGNQLLIEPALKRNKETAKQIVAAKANTSALQAQVEIFALKSSEDPDRESRLELAQLREDLNQLEGMLKGAILDLVPPKEMAGILEDILSLQPSLSLVSLTKLATEPWPPLSEAEAKQPIVAQRVFRHAVEFQFEGSYRDALEFFQKLETLPRRVFWEGLDIELLEYPTARITLTVTTMSLAEGWIGV